MKTVTQNFKDAQKQPSPVYVRQIWYKRRYWVESTKAYTWEANWTQYTEDNIVDVSDVTWQLDITTLNEFKTANVTVTVQNLLNQWRADNPYGIFKKDSTSPVFGYEAYWTKFQIRAGLQFGSTETTEVVPVFTGVATDYNADSMTGAMQITLTGEEALLIGSNAESVSTTVTNETLTGAVNGSNKDFTTAHNGVGIFTEVSDNGGTKRAGADYTLSQLNDASNPGKVSFLVAPLSGHTVRGSYIYWNTSQKFETLVTALLNQAGIAGANQFVSPVIFASNIINSHTWQTQADWQGGSSLTDIDTTFQPDAIKLDFTGTDARQLTTYADSTSGWSGQPSTGQMSVGYLAANTSPGGMNTLYRPVSTGSGRWEVTNKIGASGGYWVWTPTAQAFAGWAHDVTTVGSATLGLYGGYCLFVYNSGGSTWTIALARMDTSSSQTILTSVTRTSDSSDHTFRFVRYPGGSMIVYVDGTSTLTATDSTYLTGNYTGFTGLGTALLAKSSTYYMPATTLTGTWISSSIDFGSTPTAWSQVTDDYTTNGATITFYTAASADNITYDSYVQVNNAGVNGSTLRRYLKTKIIMVATLASNNDPIVNDLTVGSITSSTVITLANFTGMTCYDAITALANFSNYEFGFDANENFFFRPKVPGATPVFALAESDFGIQVVSQVPGYDRVFSKIRATYAGYIKDIGDDGLMYLDPLPRFGYNLLDINGGNLLISADADVATGMAGSFFGYYRLPRRRVKLSTIIIPQLDISDVINVSFQDLQPTRWFLGDTSTYIGDTTKSLYGPEEQVVPIMLSKVVGLRINTNDWTTELDLEEVL